MTRLTIGIAGAGHIAAAHLVAWRRSPGCRLEGVFDLDREAAERRAAAVRGMRVYESFAELVAGCDVIDLCTPPHTHAELARQALTAGKDLLTEKPVVTRLADWEEIAPLVGESERRLAVVHNLKHLRAVRRAKKWLDEGRIGRLLRLERVFLTDPTSDRMLARPHWSHELPGGRWFETLPHELYLIYYFAGPLEVRQVTALATPEAPAGAPANEVVITLAGPDRLASIHYSASCARNRRELSLVGSEGSITIDILSDSAVLTRMRDSRWRRASAGVAETVGWLAAWPLDRVGYLADRLRGRTPHAALIEQFAAHLQGRAESPTPLAEIDYVVRNAELIAGEIDSQVGR